MKKLILLLIAMMLGLMAFAQAPLSFNYQAVVRDLTGSVLVDKEVSFRVSILSGSTSGTLVYREIHSEESTNEFGLVELEIGKGSASMGAFSDITWGDNTYFLKIEIDPEGGSTWEEIGTTQLVSVPYALYARSSDFECINNRPTTLEGYGITDAVSQASVDVLKQKIDKISWILEDPFKRGLVKDCEGNDYKTIMIGTQTWMAENLKTTKYDDETLIPNVIDDATWNSLTSDAYCWFNNDIGNKDIYGALYNWHAVKTGKLCPEGWHVPSDSEWKQLEMALGMTHEQADAFSWRGTDQGTQMKTTSGWNDNGNGTNSSGFSGLPSGYRGNSNFVYIGYYGFWWTSSEGSEGKALVRGLNYSGTTVSRGSGNAEYGNSVRCLRD